jgi:tetratricopeptide (TPR) repeat protein
VWHFIFLLLWASSTTAVWGIVTIPGSQELEPGVLAPSFMDLSSLPFNPDPLSREGQLARIQRMLQTGAIEAAISSARELAREHPDYVPASQILASALMAIGAFQEGEAEMKKVVAAHPKDPALLCQLGGVQLLGKAVSRAMETFSKALELNPAYAPAYYGLGIVAEQQKRFDEAVRFYERGIKQSRTPAPIAIQLNLARLYNQRGQFQDTISLLAGKLPQDRSADFGRMMLGMAYLGAGRKSEAEKEIEIVRQTADGDDRLLLWLGAAYRELGRPEQSIQAFDKVSANLDGEALFEKAETFAALGRIEEAQAAYMKSAENGVQPWLATKRVGDLLLAHGRKQEAINAYQEMLGSPGLPLTACDAVGTAFEKAELFPQALAVYLAAAERFPKEPLPLHRLGMLYLALDQPDQAISHLDQVLQIRPGDLAALKLLSRAYQKQGALEKAIKTAEKVAATEPASVADRLLLAGLLEQTGRQQEAVAAYRKVIDLDARHVVALNNLAYLLGQSGHGQEALRYARSAVAFAPKPDAAVLDTLGWILVAQGSIEEAAKVLEQSSSLSPNDPSIRYHLGVAYKRLGKPRQALEQFERAISISTAFPEYTRACKARDQLRAADLSGK